MRTNPHTDRCFGMSKEALIDEVSRMRKEWERDGNIQRMAFTAAVERLAELGVPLRGIRPAKGVCWREDKLVMALIFCEATSASGVIERLINMGAMSWEAHPIKILRNEHDPDGARGTSFDKNLGWVLALRQEHLAIGGESPSLIELDAFVVIRRVFRDSGRGGLRERADEMAAMWRFAKGRAEVEKSVLSGISAAMEINRRLCLSSPRPIKAREIESALCSALAAAMGSEAARAAAAEVVRERREMERASEGMEQWMGALSGAIACDGADAARVIIAEMSKIPGSLGSIAWKPWLPGRLAPKSSGEPPVGAVRFALAHGAVKCAKLLLDAGAPLLLFLDVDGKIHPGANPFALLGKSICQGVSSAESLAQDIYPIMIKELGSLGMDGERSIALASEAVADAGKRLRLPKYKSAIERLVLACATTANDAGPAKRAARRI